MIVLVACVATIAGFLFGFDEGVIAGVEASLEANFMMSPSLEGFMKAAVPLGALAGAVVAGRLSDALGRRRILIIAAITFAAGSVLAAVSPNVEVLIAARLVLGLAIGVAGMVAPLYISEIADAERPGALVTTYQLAITLGIVSAYGVGYALTNGGHWRWMFATGAVPAVILLLGALRVPESPRWLALKGDIERARANLARLRDSDGPEVEQELTEMMSVSTGHADSHWRDLLERSERSVRPAVIAALGLYALQQL